HPNPLLYTSPLPAHRCARCNAATLPANNVLRYNKAGDYQIFWHDVGHTIVLRMEVGNYRILLTDDVLPNDTVAFAPTMDLNPPGGGRWFGAMSTYGGGHRYMDVSNGMVPSHLTTTRMKLGQNDQGNAFGLAHLIRRHPQMFRNLTNNPPTAPATF